MNRGYLSMDKEITDNPENRKRQFAQLFADLYSVLTTLRSPDGCPWDREQTPQSFYKNLIEESYEYIDAFLKGDLAECREELGDMYLVVTMLVIMHEECGDFSLEDVLAEVSEKLIRRHPHVFRRESLSSTPEDGSQVLKLWNSIKENVEGKKSEDIFSRIPASAPNLIQAVEIQKKARKTGFDWDNRPEVLQKIREEIEELEEAVEASGSRAEDQEKIAEEFGDVLFSLINYARFISVDPNEALFRANRKFKLRFARMQQLLLEEGHDILEEILPLQVLDTAWEKVKREVLR
jgi:tetrapyrrole methylase family protein / MazG family protein